jgi:hypothetical protein
VPAATGNSGTPGSPASNGLGTAATTPAAGHVPTSVPPVTSGGSTSASNGLGTAATTPAAGHVPTSVPARP